MQMNPQQARGFWKALMDNSTALLSDAAILLRAGSYGRARSLTILAQEELGKALWLYEAFASSWNTGDTAPLEVPRLKSHGRSHATKYMESFVFGQELAEFWGDYDSYDDPGATQEDWVKFFAERQREAEAAGKNANDNKMLGFYVDFETSSGEILAPSNIKPGNLEVDLQLAAQVVEMLLIKDHSRMKLDADAPYDSTHSLQHRLLPISHPEDWAVASEEFKMDGSPDGA